MERPVWSAMSDRLKNQSSPRKIAGIFQVTQKGLRFAGGSATNGNGPDEDVSSPGRCSAIGRELKNDVL